MRMPRLAGALPTIALLASVSGASPCIQVELKDAYSKAQLVFVGEVRGITPTTSSGGATVTGEEATDALYTLKVVEEFKGTGAREYSLLGDAPLPSPQAGSGVVIIKEDAWPLEVGESYLIFAYGAPPSAGSGAPPRIGSCPPSAPLSKAGATIGQLRKVRAHGRHS